jgi:pSer/pThr/pTyr-binding forkhead associated (FHA) protein
MPLRLLVIDGANQGQFFILPEQGTVTIGRSQRHADIILHDLYVARVHCEVQVSDESVLVRALPEGTTLVNGTKVAEQVLQHGDKLRVGNSHLRLEPHLGEPDETDVETVEEAEVIDDEEAEEAEVVDDEQPAPQSIDPHKLPHLPLERLGELSGRLLSHYKLGEVLGEGHYGVVFSANHVKSGHVIALKILSPEFPQNPGEMQTFVQALKTLLLVRHPNLVTLYNAGKTGPYCWLALEHVEGTSLAQALREPDARRRSHWKPALRMAIHLAHALQFLQSRKLVHGNISPANVLMGHDKVGREKKVKLADLMLSRALEGSTLQESRLETKLEAELGYMAPEQINGAPADQLTDLYGLGAVLYARLTGGPPFEGDTPAETIELINSTVPIKPTKIHPNIPDELSTAVMLLLARHPEDRFQSPRDLLDALENLAEQEGIEV